MMDGVEWVLKNHPMEAEQYLKEAARSGASMDKCAQYFSENMRNLLVRDLQAIDRKVPSTGKARNAWDVLRASLDYILDDPWGAFDDYVWENIRRYGYRARDPPGDLTWTEIPYETDDGTLEDRVASDSYEYQLEAVKRYIRDNPDFFKGNSHGSPWGAAEKAVYDYCYDVYRPILQGIDPELAELLDGELEGMDLFGWSCRNPRVSEYIDSVEREYMDNVKPNRTLGAANRATTTRKAPRETVHSVAKSSRNVSNARTRTAKTGFRSVKSKTASKSVRTKTTAKKTVSKKPAGKTVSKTKRSGR